jgi:hypothetical protein
MLAAAITGLAHRGGAREPDARGHGDGRGKQHGRAGEPQMLKRERGDLAAVLREESGAHGRACLSASWPALRLPR